MCSNDDCPVLTCQEAYFEDIERQLDANPCLIYRPDVGLFHSSDCPGYDICEAQRPEGS